MVLAQKSLADGQLPDSKGTIYTVPSGTVAAPRFLSLYNTNASTQTIVIYLKRSGSSSRAIRRIVLAQYESALVFDKDDDLCLSPADEIEATTTTASAVDYALTGGEGYS